jgi:ectoine hydroxylase-related dioxygenase (phytanoyl-CoA dioxygenase family)
VREAFDRDGWLVVRRVVTPAEVAAMQALFTTIIPDVPYPRGSDGVIRELTGMARAHPPLDAIARDPRFGALAAAALGASKIQFLQDSLLYKPAHDGGSVEWHQDHTYVGFLVPARVIAIRIALLPEHPRNGCMRAVTGSHHWGPIGANHSLRAASVTSLATELSEPQRAALADAATLELEPGDVSIHHCLTVHGSGPNHGADPRRTIILRMFDAECRLDATRLPEHMRAFFPTDASGGLATSAFPIVAG